MIEEHAVILSLDEVNDKNQSGKTCSIATLEIVRKSACGLCGQTRGCGNSIWGKLFNHQSAHFTAQNDIDAKVGDSVIVGIDETALMKGALLLYIAPLVTMMLGAILSQKIYGSDAAAMLGALAGLTAGFVWIKGHMEGRAYYQQHQPKILRLDNVQFEEKAIQFK